MARGMVICRSILLGEGKNHHLEFSTDSKPTWVLWLFPMYQFMATDAVLLLVLGRSMQDDDDDDAMEDDKMITMIKLTAM